MEFSKGPGQSVPPVSRMTKFSVAFLIIGFMIGFILAGIVLSYNDSDDPDSRIVAKMEVADAEDVSIWHYALYLNGIMVSEGNVSVTAPVIVSIPVEFEDNITNGYQIVSLLAYNDVEQYSDEIAIDVHEGNNYEVNFRLS